MSRGSLDYQRRMPTPSSPVVASRRAPTQHRMAHGEEPGRVPTVVRETLRTSGEALDLSTRTAMERRFGHDFSQVRIHTDARAAESAESVHAAAYTLGQNVVFGAGRYAPATDAGRWLLAHELAHVVQQDGGAAGAGEEPAMSEPGDASERAAEAAADVVFGGGRASVGRRSGPQVQRLDLGDEDPIHKPIIEQYRKEHGLPLSGKDEFGEQVGPSDAEIKYSLNVPHLPPAYHLTFDHDPIPAAPDHTQLHPGPKGGTADLAGYTRVTLGGQMTVSWDAKPAQANGQVPIFLRSIDITYTLKPIIVMVSSQYGEKSCPYRVTLAHEQAHATSFVQLFDAGRATLTSALLGVNVPTENSPMIVAPGDVSARQAAIEKSLMDAIKAHRAALKAQMEADRDAKDSPGAYAATYALCPASDW